MRSRWLQLLLQMLSVQAATATSITTVHPVFDLGLLSSRSELHGIWKVKVSGANQQLDLRAFTHAEPSMVKSDCRPVDVNILVQLGAPALPAHLREHEIGEMYAAPIPLLNSTLNLESLAPGANTTNEQLTTLTFDNYGTDVFYFITGWYSEVEEVNELPLKTRIENKFGLSTLCQPRLQFNLTTQPTENNDPSGDEIKSVPQPDTLGSSPLSKQSDGPHQVFFYDSPGANATISWNCSNNKDSTTLSRHFSIDAEAETGGVLELTLNGHAKKAKFCLSQTTETKNASATCVGEEYHLTNNQTFYVPQPTAGLWRLDLSTQECVTQEFNESDTSLNSSLNITLTGCINDCGAVEDRGVCKTYYTAGNFIMSSCSCKAGYDGLSCSNDEQAMSSSLQLLQMMLLTLSNLFFLPAIFIGLYRRYWQETIVYIIAMAVSTVYHACDQGHTQKYYCLAEYDTLQYADFLAATVAIWVTVLAIADLPSRWSSILHNTGIMCFAVGAHHNRFSLWLYAAPIVVGVAILITHWIYQCRLRRDCYPTSRTWMCHLLPGVLLATAGFVVKICFEFDDEHYSNFYWTHTLWHALLGLSCAFLLPDVAYDATKLYNSNNDNLISYYKSFGDPTFEPNAL